jgi:hypothetical protein
MKISEVEDLIFKSEINGLELIEDYKHSYLFLFPYKIVVNELNITLRHGLCEHKEEYKYLEDFNFYMIYKNNQSDYEYWLKGSLKSVLEHYIFNFGIAFNGNINNLDIEVIYDKLFI